MISICIKAVPFLLPQTSSIRSFPSLSKSHTYIADMPEPEGWPERIQRARATAKRVMEESQRDLPGQARLREMEQQRRALEQAGREQGKSQAMRPSREAAGAVHVRRLFTEHEQRAFRGSRREAVDPADRSQRGQEQPLRVPAVGLKEQGDKEWEVNKDDREGQGIEENQLARVVRGSRESHEVQEQHRREEQRTTERREQAEELAKAMKTSFERRAKEDEQLAKAMEESHDLEQSFRNEKHKDELWQALQASLVSSQQGEAMREEDIRRAMRFSLEQEEAVWREQQRQQREEEQDMARALQASHEQPRAASNSYQRDRCGEREERRQRRCDRQPNRQSQGRNEYGATELPTWTPGAAPDRGTHVGGPSTWH